MPPKPVQPDLDLLLVSWQLALRADRKSDQTLKSYSDGVRLYLAWCTENAAPPLERASIRTWVAALLEQGNQPSTARARQLAVRRFTAWLVDENELDTDPFLGLRAPKLDSKVIEPLSDDQLRALLKACTSPKGCSPSVLLRCRRDEAIIRLMLETGIRAGEVIAMMQADVNAIAGTAIIRRGKGGKGRIIPFGPFTAQSLDRYMRLRTHHKLAVRPDLWLGDRSKGFSYDALHKALAKRADAAGIVGFHPHRMRHTAAHRWLAAGGSEGGLMAVAGWSRPDSLMRYTKAQASSRAAIEARSLNLGEL